MVFRVPCKKRSVMNMTHSQIVRFLRSPSSELVDFAISLANLDKKESAVIQLCGRKGFTQEEAAEILDRSPDAIQKWWRSGVLKLKSAWDGRWWIQRIIE